MDAIRNSITRFCAFRCVGAAVVVEGACRHAHTEPLLSQQQQQQRLTLPVSCLNSNDDDGQDRNSQLFLLLPLPLLLFFTLLHSSLPGLCCCCWCCLAVGVAAAPRLRPLHLRYRLDDDEAVAADKTSATRTTAQVYRLPRTQTSYHRVLLPH